MKNEMKRININEWNQIYQQLKKKQNVWIAEIDGSKVPTWEDYAHEIEKVFRFPTPCDKSMDSYLDWIRDLSWIDDQEFVLIIRNFSLFLKDDLTTKNEIIDDFKEIILPWWETEVEQCVVGGKAKPFNIYLID